MYESLKELEKIITLDELVKCGIVSNTIAKHKHIYEVFLNENQKGYGTIKSVKNTAKKTCVPETTIYKVIKRMRR